MCFCAGSLAGLGLSWINKYNNKTASRWQQVPVLINGLLNHSNQTIHSKQFNLIYNLIQDLNSQNISTLFL